ncbi:MAG: zinc-binding dehydrogenase [marine benthic group bacterium]|nr:zinc-binding dehydrogenase [Gemmatimonadota bacterium]
MRQVWIEKTGPPEVLRVREAPDPVPGPGELRVRVAFAGVNFAEVMARLGLYPDAPQLPFVPGYEVAGTVDEVGPGVEGYRVGERVTAVTRFGGYADCVCLPPALVVRTPDAISDADAAAIPVNYLTAHQMLHRVCAVRSGEVVLVHGVAGGVGTAATQLCDIVGAKVIGTASAQKHDRLREVGVEPIASNDPDLVERVRDITNGRGVDIALDPIGGRSFRTSYELLAPGGRLCCFGVSAMAPGRRKNLLAALASLARMPRFGPIGLMNDNRSVAGVNLGHLWDETEMLVPQFEAIMSHAAAGRIRPVLDSTHALDRASDAHERLQSRRSVGKVLLAARGDGGEHPTR